MNMLVHDKEKPVVELTVSDCFPNMKYCIYTTDSTELLSNVVSAATTRLMGRQSIVEPYLPVPK
jgi:hypothetical protein